MCSAKVRVYIHILSKMPTESFPDFFAQGPIFFASTPYMTLPAAPSITSTFSSTWGYLVASSSFDSSTVAVTFSQ